MAEHELVEKFKSGMARRRDAGADEAGLCYVNNGDMFFMCGNMNELGVAEMVANIMMARPECASAVVLAVNVTFKEMMQAQESLAKMEAKQSVH